MVEARIAISRTLYHHTLKGLSTRSVPPQPAVTSGQTSCGRIFTTHVRACSERNTTDALGQAISWTRLHAVGQVEVAGNASRDRCRLCHRGSTPIRSVVRYWATVVRCVHGNSLARATEHEPAIGPYTAGAVHAGMLRSNTSSAANPIGFRVLRIGDRTFQFIVLRAAASYVFRSAFHLGKNRRTEKDSARRITPP